MNTKYKSMGDMMMEDEEVMLKAAKDQMMREDADPVYQAALAAKMKAAEEMPDLPEVEEEDEEEEDED
jgi:hypothetical protein